MGNFWLGKKAYYLRMGKELARGVTALGPSQRSSCKKTYNHVKKTTAKKSVEVKAESYGRWYAADDVKKPLFSRKSNHKQTKLRGSITPGTVLILLAGQFKGKRVVFLKQLDSGLLLVSGPFKINGVPLRRVNQAYVIGTSTKLDVSGVDVSSINDDFFGKTASGKTKKSGEEFFKEGEKKHEVSAAKKDAQKKVDTPLLKAVEAVPELKSYMAARFTLTKNDKPHDMKF